MLSGSTCGDLRRWLLAVLSVQCCWHDHGVSKRVRVELDHELHDGIWSI